ncbi:Cyclic di-GMP phosphodiesterase response regulator RpfG [Anaerolineae bacterium]|nr:Cyclic di-GMP phosphodiesterase response regulator RpfG [Anaerolineae bacterium]
MEFVSNVYLVGEEQVIQCNIRDSTEHTRLVAALQENKKKYHTLVTQFPDGIFLIDLSGNILSVNKAICDGLGFSEEELRSMNIWDLVPDQYLDQYKTRLTKILQGKILHEPSEYTVRGKDGKILFLEVLSAPYYSEKGIIGFQGIARDITARKRAEEALRESEDRFRELFENANDIVYTHDLAGNYTSVNRASEQITGYTREESLTLNIAQVVAPEYLALANQMTQSKVSGGTPTSYQLEILAKDGHRVPLEVSTRLIYREGNPIGVQGIARDITKRKRAEEALHESEERFRALIENSADVIALFTGEGIILYESPSVRRILGYSPAEMVGHNGFEFIHPDDYADCQELFGKLFQLPQTPVTIEFRHKRKDDTWAWVQATGTNLLAEPSVKALIVNYQDITERKRAEETLRQRLTELEAVHTVSSALRTAQTRDEALPILLDETLSALETDAGAIWLYHSDSGELRAAVNRGWFGQLDQTAMKPGEGIAGTVFTSGQAHRSTEFARDPLARPGGSEIPAGWGGVCLPIRSGAITVGVLFVAMPLPCQITPEQAQVLESLSEMAGTTLHRMNLHEETVRQLDRLEALHSIDLAINASMDLRVTLNILLEHVNTQLNADAASVLLLNPHAQTLEYAAGRGFRTRIAETAHIRLGEDFVGRAALERRAVQANDPAQVQNSSHFAALWAGEGFTAYYGMPLIAKGQVKGVLEVFHRAAFHPEPNWISFLETLAGQAAIAIDNGQLFDHMQRSNADLALAYDATIEGWSRALDLRDKETEGHTQRVTEITMRLAKAMGFGDAELIHIHRGGLLHDIGKMGVPDSILLKPDKLTNEEWKLMRMHPQLAFNLISPINYLRPALDIPYCHHEKWDGTGYPRGLEGEQIPLAARIFAVVDVWDALRTDRPYRAAWSEDIVLEYIRSQAGIHFDPQVVKVCLESGVLGTLAPE